MKVKNINRIVFTGGGSGGHIMPALTLISKFQRYSGLEIIYIGSKDGIEKDLVSKIGIKYHIISTGKLRRYFSFKNISDILKILNGIIQSFFLMLGFDKKTIVFSTGGFVSVPAVIGAFLTGKKIFTHEQTSRAGLANKINAIFATRVFVSYRNSLKYFPAIKTIYTGYPVREEFFISYSFKKKKDKPILFFTGGGNGSKLINDFVVSNLETLSSYFSIHHQVGKSHYDKFKKLKSKDYHVYSFLEKKMIFFLLDSDIIVSRAGAGTVCELMVLQKKSIFIPLKIAQQNEQYFNAKEAQKLLDSIIIEEDELINNDKKLLDAILNFDVVKKERHADISKYNGTFNIVNEVIKAMNT